MSRRAAAAVDSSTNGARSAVVWAGRAQVRRPSREVEGLGKQVKVRCPPAAAATAGAAPLQPTHKAAARQQLDGYMVPALGVARVHHQAIGACAQHL